MPILSAVDRVGASVLGLFEFAGARATFGAKRFGALAVLDEVSFDIPAGTAFCLLGRSGTGKSVTLRPSPSRSSKRTVRRRNAANSGLGDRGDRRRQSVCGGTIVRCSSAVFA